MLSASVRKEHTPGWQVKEVHYLELPELRGRVYFSPATKGPNENDWISRQLATVSRNRRKHGSSFYCSSYC